MKKIKYIVGILILGLFIFSICSYMINRTHKVIFLDENNEVLETRYIKHNGHIEYNIPDKEGYTFIYWTLNGEKNRDSNIVTSNLTLKANYKLTDDELVIVTYKYPDKEEIVYVKIGEKLVKRDNKKWYLDGKEFDFNTEIKESMTLKSEK